MQKTEKLYTVFGLIIKSEFDLPELTAATGDADVAIVWGEVPTHLETPVEKTPWFQIAGGQFLLSVDGIASYFVENGNRIVIEPYQNSKSEDVRVFLLNTVLAVLLHQRDYLVLHGSAAVVDGKALAIVGPSQTGKTSIALNLYNRGYTLLSDEICAIKIENSRAMIFPGIPQLNVWRDTLAFSGKDPDRYQPIRSGIKKYAVPIHDQFGETSFELENIVFLKHHNLTIFLNESVHGGDRFKQLIQHAYFVEAVTDKVQHFKLCAAIIKYVFLCQVTFNEQPYQVDQITDFMLKELQK